MKNIPLTLSEAFDLGLICINDIYKESTKEEKQKAEIDYAIRFIENINRRSWFGKFFI